MTHSFKGDYILGITHDNVSVADRVLSFPYASRGFNFSLPEDTTRCDLQVWWSTAYDKDHFPSVSELFTRHGYLHPKVVIKLRVEEILQLTRV